MPRKSKVWEYASTVFSNRHIENSDPKINFRRNSNISGMEICNLSLFPAYISYIYKFRGGSLSRVKKKIKHFNW